jgi:hypothetical protein
MKINDKMPQFNDLSIKGNVYADRFIQSIKKAGIDFATGLPCGELRSFIYNLSTDNSIMHKPGLSEQESIAIAAGAWLGGKIPIIYAEFRYVQSIERYRIDFIGCKNTCFDACCL